MALFDIHPKIGGDNGYTGDTTGEIRKIYIVTSHENLIDTDSVTIVCATPRKETAIKEFLMERERYYGIYEIYESNLESYCKFVDKHREKTIEIEVVKTSLFNW